MTKPERQKRNEALLIRHRDGDEAAGEKLIEENVRLIDHYVWKAVKGERPSQWRDELYTVGLHALWRAVQRLRDLPHDNPAAYMSLWIRRAIWRACQRRWKQPRTLLPRGKRLVPLSPKLAVPDDCQVVDFLDYARSGCNDDTDRAIVELGSRHWTEKDIAEELGLTVSTIFYRRKKIAKRAREKLRKSEGRGETG